MNDRFNNLDPSLAARAAMLVISNIQNLQSREAQIHGITAAFVILMERLGLDPQDTVTKTKNLMAWENDRRPEFRAVEQYVKEEL